jgi:hypothetical protein
MINEFIDEIVALREHRDVLELRNAILEQQLRSYIDLRNELVERIRSLEVQRDIAQTPPIRSGFWRAVSRVIDLRVKLEESLTSVT